MPDALWDGRRFRTFNVIDDFSREAFAVEIDLNLPASRVISTLERVAAWCGYQSNLRLDNGPEFVALALVEWAERKGIRLNFIEPGRPMQNGFIERSNGSFRRGVLDMHVFRNLAEVREQAELWLADYNREIPLDSLGGLTPPSSGSEISGTLGSWLALTTGDREQADRFGSERYDLGPQAKSDTFRDTSSTIQFCDSPSPHVLKFVFHFVVKC